MGAIFREFKGVRVEYNRQGYIFFISRLYKELPESEKRMIESLCEKCGEEYSAALFEFVTTDRTATSVCMRHYISKGTLYRCVRRYYESFPRKIRLS
ncbi:MAG: hypothetical protein ACI4RV_01395 [Eubacteriales bacterium]